MKMMKRNIEEDKANASGSSMLVNSSVNSEQSVRNSREESMKRSLKLGLPAVAVAAAMVLAGLGVGASQGRDVRPGIDERGWVTETQVKGVAPDILRGLMPEVIVEAKVPDANRGRMPEVVARARAPWTMSSVGEVRVRAERPAGTAVAAAGAAGASRVN